MGSKATKKDTGKPLKPSESWTYSYRVLVSDGVHYQQGMLGTQQNSLVHEGKVDINTVVRLTEYVCNSTANNKRCAKLWGFPCIW
jgi:Replication factor-A protein 1, N-terminal domain